MNENIISSLLKDALLRWEMGLRYVTMVTPIYAMAVFGVCGADWWRTVVVTVVHKASLCD